jgi:hypothetical protein
MCREVRQVLTEAPRKPWTVTVSYFGLVGVDQQVVLDHHGRDVPNG